MLRVRNSLPIQAALPGMNPHTEDAVQDGFNIALVAYDALEDITHFFLSTQSPWNWKEADCSFAEDSYQMHVGTCTATVMQHSPFEEDLWTGC